MFDGMPKKPKNQDIMQASINGNNNPNHQINIDSINIFLQGTQSVKEAWLLCLTVGSHQDSLCLEQFGKFSILVHRHQDIASADKLLVQI